MTSQIPTDAANARPATPAEADTHPLSGPRRLGLLLILLILPVIAVSLPAILVTMIFGQRPRPAAPAATAAVSAAPDVSGLRNALERNAQGVLPAPGALAAEPIVLTVRADHMEARAARVETLARQFGGSTSAGLPQAGEKDLYVDLPAAATGEFRAALARAAAPASPAPVSNAGPGPIDHLEVIVRAAADDE